MANYVLITTGGTIDAPAYPPEGAPTTITRFDDYSRTASYLAVACHRQGDLLIHPDLQFVKDSKDITPSDTAALCQMVIEAQKRADAVFITLGSDRTPEIARHVAFALLGIRCPVIFTCAMLPLANGPQSDGFANLNEVVRQAPNLNPGFYVVTAGFVENCLYVVKDFAAKRMVSKRTPTPQLRR